MKTFNVVCTAVSLPCLAAGLFGWTGSASSDVLAGLLVGGLTGAVAFPEPTDNRAIWTQRWLGFAVGWAAVGLVIVGGAYVIGDPPTTIHAIVWSLAAIMPVVATLAYRRYAARLSPPPECC